MRKEKVLLVDDEIAILDICEKILGHNQYDIFTASSGEKAMEILDKEIVDILVTDIKMPGMSGKKLLEEGKKKYPDMSAAIITGYGDMRLAIDTMHLGAQAFIIKPFSPTELKEMVENLAEKKVLLKENLRLKTLVPLLESSRKMLKKIDYSEICNIVIKEALEGIKADGAAILLRQKTGCRLQSESGFDKKLLENILNDKLLLNRISKGKKQVLINGEDLFYKKNRLANTKIIFTPLIQDEEVAGLLVTVKEGVDDKFSEGELEFLSILSNHLAASMDRSRLYREIESALAEVKEAEKLKDIFLCNISYEFMTPLNIVTGFAEVMLESYSGGKSPSYEKEKLEIIRDKGEELLTLFEKLVDASILEAGTIKYKLKPSNLSSFISEVYPDIREEGEKKGLQVIYKDSRKKLRTSLDEELIKKVLKHVLDNAVKFTEKGKIEISADRVGAEIILKVEDSGIGISKDKKDSIFKKFRQGDDSMTRRFAGAGLGLYITEKMVKLMNGTIEAESPPPGRRQGSLFTVTFPAL